MGDREERERGRERVRGEREREEREERERERGERGERQRERGEREEKERENWMILYLCTFQAELVLTLGIFTSSLLPIAINFQPPPPHIPKHLDTTATTRDWV